MPTPSNQALADTYRQIINVLKARLADDGTPDVLTEGARADLEDWLDVFEIRVRELQGTSG